MSPFTLLWKFLFLTQKNGGNTKLQMETSPLPPTADSCILLTTFLKVVYNLKLLFMVFHENY